jgi:hypothetical protein
MNLGGSGG